MAAQPSNEASVRSEGCEERQVSVERRWGSWGAGRRLAGPSPESRSRHLEGTRGAQRAHAHEAAHLGARLLRAPRAAEPSFSARRRLHGHLHRAPRAEGGAV